MTNSRTSVFQYWYHFIEVSFCNCHTSSPATDSESSVIVCVFVLVPEKAIGTQITFSSTLNTYLELVNHKVKSALCCSKQFLTDPESTKSLVETNFVITLMFFFTSRKSFCMLLQYLTSYFKLKYICVYIHCTVVRIGARSFASLLLLD